MAALINLKPGFYLFKSVCIHSLLYKRWTYLRNQPRIQLFGIITLNPIKILASWTEKLRLYKQWAPGGLDWIRTEKQWLLTEIKLHASIFTLLILKIWKRLMLVHVLSLFCLISLMIYITSSILTACLSCTSPGTFQ